MKEVPDAIVRWLEQKRRRDRTSAAVISVLALGSGTVVFVVTSLVIYTFLSFTYGALEHPGPWLGPLALGLTAAIFVLCVKGRQDDYHLGLDSMGFWIIKDIGSIGPRLILEGLRQVRACGQLGEVNVAACARALTYLAQQNSAVTCQELIRHCPQLAWPRLREQLSLLDGVLFLGDDTDRVTLMDPFRLRLRWMLEQERAGYGQPAQPRPEPASQAFPVNEPEKLSAYEILGLSTSASFAEIHAAYRKRVKECHPDLFAGMDQQSQALAERWTKALNVAYGKLKPRQAGAKPSPTGQR